MSSAARRLPATASLTLAAVCLAATAPTGQTLSEEDLERASRGRTIRVRLGSHGRATTTEMPLEVYVARVLAGEGEPRAAAAAQQALAIAVRTFAVASGDRHARDRFDLCDTTHCQVLRPSTPASREAAFVTASQLLMHEGRPALVFYSASCGGRSEAVSNLWGGTSDLPYLRASHDDAHEEDEEWVLEVSMAKVEAALRRAGFAGGRLRDIEVERRSSSGRVTALRLSGLRPAVVSGEAFRAALGPRDLRSTQFTFSRRGRTLRFTGRGYGHGVGLCVIGAGRRAARGETAAAILQQYYPGLIVHSLGSPATAANGHATATAPAARRTEDQIVTRVAHELAVTLGVQPAPELKVRIYESLDEFRSATGRAWWVTAAVDGDVISLPPTAVLGEQSGLEPSIRRGVAEALIAAALPDRPAWVRVGAARYFAAAVKPVPPNSRVICPSDAELMLAVSAPAQREAELRAEACFARALTRAKDWRAVK